MSRERTDFLRDIIDADLQAGVHQRVATRFPPEPNGYLHIGHAKSICLNFGLANEYRGTCNLRYDDTNPTKEDVEYVTSIENDVRWLGFDPSKVLFSADYFERMYAWAQKLIRQGDAYVCDLNDEAIREYRGTLSEPGKASPYRTRSVDENLARFADMRAGSFADGACTLRAKIDMASANMKMRDPLLYRIRHAHHHRSGDAWCIYPMYDFAHPLEDAIEGITHSICTLEFENNRELYDWVLARTDAARDCGFATPPRQYEFARLQLDYTVMSKRKLLTLVTGKHVSGWDDPRMPTIAGLRRRGYAPAAIRAFCDLIGIAKNNSFVDIGKLEYCVRDELNQNAPRAMAVVTALPFTITNWDALVAVEPAAAQGHVVLHAPNFPTDVTAATQTRDLVFGARLLLEREDFAEVPSADFRRLAPGRTVRLRYGYCITCDAVEHAADGTVTGLRGRIHPETKAGGAIASGEKVWGVVHWVDAATAAAAEFRLYDRLFSVAKPEEGGTDFLQVMNPNSLRIVHGHVERSLASAAAGARYQFERVGYFVADCVDHAAARLVFNRIIDLGGASAAAAASTTVAPAPAAGIAADAKPKNAKAQTRPKSKSPQEFREEARRRDPALAAAFTRFSTALAGNAHDADLLSGDSASAALFAACLDANVASELAAKWMINELPRALGETELAASQLTAARFIELLRGVASNQFSASAGKLILAALVTSAITVSDAVAEVGVTPVDANALPAAIAATLAANAPKVAQYRAGKTGLLGFFVGQVMKANPSFDAAAVHAAVAEALLS